MCSALDATYKTLTNTKPSTPEELQAIFPSLDNFKYVDKWYVFDIGGNTLRLIGFLEFNSGKYFIKYIVSHAEYDRITDGYSTKKIKR